jgi:hypothetical protein
MTQDEIDTLLANAFTAARVAADEMIAKHPDQWYPCGFAWVAIKPARGPVVKALKEADAGYVSSEGGYHVYNPSRNPTQWMDAKIAGADAFAKVLREAGIKAYTESRID